MVLEPAEKLALAVMVLLIMLGMGSTLSLKNFKDVAKEPKGQQIPLLYSIKGRKN